MKAFSIRLLIFVLAFFVGFITVFQWKYISTFSNSIFADTSTAKYPHETYIYFLNNLKIPEGNEIEVEIKFYKPKQLIVTVRNASSKDIFLPYIPGTKTKWAHFAYLGMKRKNKKTNEFESLEDIYFNPDLSALKAGDSFKYLIWNDTPGIYRLSFNYVIDRTLANQINNYKNLRKSKKKALKQKRQAAIANYTSPVFEL